MKVCLICLFFLTALQDGDADERISRGMEGGNITVGCSFSFTGAKMYLCKEKCERENILIETRENRAQNGRYSIEFVKTGFISSVIYVNITNLNRSDSGWYRCCLGSIIPQYDDFYLDVTEAPNTLEPNWTPETFTATFLSFLSSTSVTTAATLTQRLNSSSSTTIQQFRTSPELKGETDPLLYVGLSLAVLIILLATALLIYCQRKNLHQKKGES
ncbi:uncharacterized protein LOC129376999 [Poeciliopsis prolifica]|uniref:uncharacterized protein LOC129376999 n=1 Tax=Poeciliopsis prolifica TaxID=188132 RepID=UPI00241442DE|nr:uncharacterized protein LOC129376999 [Poeciliopsis prolifica]